MSIDKCDTLKVFKCHYSLSRYLLGSLIVQRGAILTNNMRSKKRLMRAETREGEDCNIYMYMYMYLVLFDHYPRHLSEYRGTSFHKVQTGYCIGVSHKRGNGL